jgi:hypothetical protein
MIKLFLIVMGLLLAVSLAFAADSTTSMSCPSGYALSVAAPPSTITDHAAPENQMPHASEKQPIKEDYVVEVARMHCVPLNETNESK